MAVDGIVTSPPYPGLIDYHEQHRYAYELLGLARPPRRRDRRRRDGNARAAVAGYVEAMAEAFANTRRGCAAGAPVVIVVNDSRDLYPGSWTEPASGSTGG